MGIITTALVAGGLLKSFVVPYWVIICCHLAIAGGTMAGGWRIIKTMASASPSSIPLAASRRTAGGLTLVGTAAFGIPVSTTTRSPAPLSASELRAVFPLSAGESLAASSGPGYLPSRRRPPRRDYFPRRPAFGEVESLPCLCSGEFISPSFAYLLTANALLRKRRRRATR